MTVQTHYERAEALSEKLLAAHERGESVSAMAAEHGLRREAIAAELAKFGIGAPSPARAAVLEYVRRNPGLSVDDLALQLDLSKSSVSRYLRGAPEHRLVVSRKKAPAQKYSDADMAAALRYAYKKLDDRSKGLSRKRYRELAAAGAELGELTDPPAAATYIRRYGTWSEACKVAGITASKARRDNYVQSFSNQDIVDAVAEYIETTGLTAYHGYADWARVNGRPSGPLLVQRLGSWAEARRLAIANGDRAA
jgi:DNA-binding transcriptional ArsR family regulator